MNPVEDLLKAIGGNKYQSVLIGDQNCEGTLLTWMENKWLVTELESGEKSYVDRIVVIKTENVDMNYGLKQVGIACNLLEGLWVIDPDDIRDLQETYRAKIEVLWEQRPI